MSADAMRKVKVVIEMQVNADALVGSINLFISGKVLGFPMPPDSYGIKKVGLLSVETIRREK